MSEIIFKEDTHQYFSKSGEELISWSALSKIFFPTFDPDGSILKRKSAELGLEPEQLKAKWDEKSKNSCTFGSWIHYYAEQHFVNPVHAWELFQGTSRYNSQSKVHKYMIQVNKLMKELQVLKTEVVVGSEKYKTAGMFDGSALYKKKLAIFDLKTNDKSEFELKNSWGKKGLGPLSHIDASQYNKYRLQLSMYKYLCELNGLYMESDRLLLIHIKENDYKIYSIKYMKEEVEAMLELYKEANCSIERLQNILSNTQVYLKGRNKEQTIEVISLTEKPLNKFEVKKMTKPLTPQQKIRIGQAVNLAQNEAFHKDKTDIDEIDSYVQSRAKDYIRILEELEKEEVKRLNPSLDDL